MNSAHVLQIQWEFTASAHLPVTLCVSLPLDNKHKTGKPCLTVHTPEAVSTDMTTAFPVGPRMQNLEANMARRQGGCSGVEAARQL